MPKVEDVSLEEEELPLLSRGRFVWAEAPFKAGSQLLCCVWWVGAPKPAEMM